MGTSRLKVILAEKDLTVRELSHLSGVSYVQCSRLVNNKHKPTLDVAHAISDALGVHIDKCFPGAHTLKKRTI